MRIIFIFLTLFLNLEIFAEAEAVVIGPPQLLGKENGSFTVSITDGDAVIKEILWNWGDGSISSGGISHKHAWEKVGDFNISVTIIAEVEAEKSGGYSLCINTDDIGSITEESDIDSMRDAFNNDETTPDDMTVTEYTETFPENDTSDNSTPSSDSGEDTPPPVSPPNPGNSGIPDGGQSGGDSSPGINTGGDSDSNGESTADSGTSDAASSTQGMGIHGPTNVSGLETGDPRGTGGYIPLSDSKKKIITITASHRVRIKGNVSITAAFEVLPCSRTNYTSKITTKVVGFGDAELIYDKGITLNVSNEKALKLMPNSSSKAPLESEATPLDVADAVEIKHNDTEYIKGASVKINVVEVKEVEIKDEQERKAKDNLLEIVAPLVGETINCKAILNPETDKLPEQFPEWIFDEQNVNKIYAVETSERFHYGGKSLVPILNKISPTEKCIKCETNFVKLRIYPVSEEKISFDPEKLLKAIDSLDLFLKQILGSVGITWDKPKGNIEFKNSWKEISDSNTAGWTWDAKFGINPLIGIKGRWPVLVPIPPTISKYMSIGPYISVNLKTAFNGVIARNEKAEITGYVEPSGELIFRAGVDFVLPKQDVIYIDAFGEIKGVLSAKIEADEIGFYINDPKFKFMPLRLVVEFSVLGIRKRPSLEIFGSKTIPLSEGDAKWYIYNF